LKRVDTGQLSFAFADSPQGGDRDKVSDVSEAKARLLLIAKGKEAKESTARVGDKSRLLEQVASRSNLAGALLNVARNKGAAGIDGRSVKEAVLSAETLLPKLQAELLNGIYRPGDIRRVWIPKPGGGQRGLGIPNVVDRWVQQAILQVLEPLVEPTFHPSSHGFRSNRGAHTAITEAKKYVEKGFNVAVDIDISKFFDRVNHQRLLNRMAHHIADGRILKLIHSMLKAKVVLPDGTRVSTEEGTPQGGPLSPFLSNIVLDELDWELERRGHRFVRYADDCNIYVRSLRAGQRVMNATRRFIEHRLRLKVNERKSSVDLPGNLHFLGFRLTRSREGQVEIHISARSKERMDRRIRELTPRMWGQSLHACIELLNRYLRGWVAYFRICTEKGAGLFPRFDAHIRRRLRAIITHQKGKRPRFLYRHLLSRGVPPNAAYGAAYCGRSNWYRSNHSGMTTAYRNAWFHERLVSLWTRWNELAGNGRVSWRQLTLFD
jgi:group II intron reverse transcriptase/maturase